MLPPPSHSVDVTPFAQCQANTVTQGIVKSGKNLSKYFLICHGFFDLTKHLKNQFKLLTQKNSYADAAADMVIG